MIKRCHNCAELSNCQYKYIIDPCAYWIDAQQQAPSAHPPTTTMPLGQIKLCKFIIETRLFELYAREGQLKLLSQKHTGSPNIVSITYVELECIKAQINSLEAKLRRVK